jgi:hypothetical protein
MPTRIQVVIDEMERELFRREARKEGKSLSTWLREAGQKRLSARESTRRITSVKQLRAFFKQCDAQEKEHEPDWQEHLAVLEESYRSGRSVT